MEHYENQDHYNYAMSKAAEAEAEAAMASNQQAQVEYDMQNNQTEDDSITVSLNMMYDKAIDHAIGIVERNRLDPDRIIENLKQLKTSYDPPQTSP